MNNIDGPKTPTYHNLNIGYNAAECLRNVLLFKNYTQIDGPLVPMLRIFTFFNFLDFLVVNISDEIKMREIQKGNKKFNSFLFGFFSSS